MTKKIIYIASPYTKGDQAINTHCQLRAFDELMNDGIVWPVIPLLSHFQHIFKPRHYQEWIDLDLALLERYDACLRIDAEYPELDYCVTESKGADGEVAAFKSMGKPVFTDKIALYEWAEGGSKQIIGLTGYATSGKDTAAEGLVAEGWTRVALADGVREALYNLDPLIECPISGKRITLSGWMCDGHVWDQLKKWPSTRKLLQRMGTEAGRNIHGDDCWIKIAKRKVDAALGPVVITDVRFANEAAAIRSWGGKIIRIDRPGVGPVNGHCSESLDFEVDAAILNDSTVEDLQGMLLDIVEEAEAVHG